MEKADVLKRKIEDASLAICQFDSWRGIPYCWADYLFEGEDAHQIIAKYLFTFTDAEEWNNLLASREEFISACILPCYFEQSGDISWNMYWISVLEQEQLERLDVQRKMLFSSNTEYTRNFLVSLEHLQDSIPAGRVPSPNLEENIPMPGDDWAQQLEVQGMAFCLDTYSSNALDDYVEGVSIESRANAESVPVSFEEQQVRCLCSASIPKSFRSHYYQKDWSIPFASVNLLYGTNGSGKTSVLSAIELGITGEVRSPDLSTYSSLDSNIVITAEIGGTVEELRPPRQPPEKKRLERQWYKTRGSNRTGVQLNNLFHRFNYLSVEETFMFSNQQPNLSDIFSKILYGSETDEMWRNRGRYLDECSRMLNSYRRDAEKYASAIERLNARQTTDMAVLRSYLSASGLNFPYAKSANDVMLDVQKILAEYDKISGFGTVISNVRANKQLSVLSSDCKLCENEISELTSEIESIREKKLKMRAQLSALTLKKESISALSKQLRRALSMFGFYCCNRKSLYNYRSLTAQSSCCELRIKELRSAIDNYGSTLKMPPERSASEIHEEMKQLQARHTYLRQMHDELAKQIDSLELANEQRTKLLASIHAEGMEFYRMDKGRCTCPLCGAQGVTSKSLSRHIDMETSRGSQELMDLYRKSEKVENELETVNSRLKLLDPIHLAAMEYGSAVDALRKSFPELNDYSDLCGAYEQAKKEINDLRADTSKVESELMTELTKEFADCSSLQPVLESRHELLDLLGSCDADLSENASDQATLSSATEARDNLVKQMQDIDARLFDILAQREILEDSLDSYIDQLKMAREDLAQKRDEQKNVEEIADFWNKISAFCSDSDMNGEALQTMCLHILDLARGVIDSEKRNAEKDQLRREMQITYDKVKRCQTLKAALKELRPPEEYADDFIKQNVEQVSRIFLALHFPQEFSHLAISENALVAFRGGEAVPVNQMSTGQRAALVIAVFFQMNFASMYAPNFLLMDEPVANIDDLNVLAMLDFLRELVICRGTQLFFTTANRNIAKLFRRKFSFLGQSFQELDFLRENENSLTIRQLCYDQSSVVSSNIL